MIGYYNVSENKSIDFDIKFSPIKDLGNLEIPIIQKDLVSKVEKTASVIQILTGLSKETKTIYFKKLVSLSQAGLAGENARPYESHMALTNLKDEIVTVRGPMIKNSYMKKLGLLAFIFSLIPISIYFIIEQFIAFNTYELYFFVWFGSMIGTWISYGVRKFNIQFYDLGTMEADMMTPSIRLIFIGISSIIFLLFFKTSIIDINIGGISFIDIIESKELQILFGFICGLVESKLGLQLYSKANNLLSLNDN